MAGDLKIKYGTSNQAITCTITSLANNTMRGSTAISNTSNLFTDALVQVQIKTASSGTTTTGYVNIYAYATSASTYPGGFSGTDGAYTGLAANLVPIGRISATSNSTTYTSNPLSVAAAFGGNLPESWGIVVENQTNTGSTALDASVGSAWYQGVLGQYS